MRAGVAGRIASLLVGIEAACVLALAGWQVVALGSADVTSYPSAIALLVLTLVGAAAVAAFAVGIARDRSWARSGAIVVQLLVVAVAIGAATGEFAHPGTAVALAAPALGVFALLLLAVRDAGRAPQS
ncbi:histidine kinase [Microbacterium gilvum]|uniref:Histidine kinase n=1 Tax=Microbacterium gilvum TaxID=1336204 RepID=A0ABP8ZZE3_9MICO